MNNSSHYKHLTLVLAIGLVGIILYHLFSAVNQPEPVNITFSEFLESVEKGDIKGVVIKEKNIAGEGRIKGEQQKFMTYAADYPDLIKILREKGVTIDAKPSDKEPLWYTIIASSAPFILFIVIWIYIMKQMQNPGKGALSFGKSKARLLSKDGVNKVTFNDVAGIDESKEELSEIIDFLKDPQKFQKLGGRIPKGVLLMGPPGTGKTLLARAIAGEADVPFFSLSGSDFVEMFVGVGASRVRDLFEQGKKHSPCIIFIDEIDAVGRHRGAGIGGGHDEREQTLNQLLVELDGFEPNSGVIIIAATNRPDVLDPALLRPGRFDREVVVPRPDIKGRFGVLKVHAKNLSIGDNVNLELIARGTPGFSGADLANLVNEAALLAARRGKKKVEMVDFDDSRDKVLMGVERKSMIISDEEKKNTAYHEAGHALVARLTPGTDPVHKVTIIPRGRALGLTQHLPIDEKHNYSKNLLLATITVLLGGRAAEKIFLNLETTGAGNDIERATEIARKMVCEWGMSDELGPMTFGKKEEQVFLGKEIASNKDYSEATAIQVDQAIKKFVTDSYVYAETLLKKNKDKLIKLANTLLEKEVLNGIEIDKIINFKAPKKNNKVQQQEVKLTA
ncbi:MAG: ATP-dependent zinc metalloprotease FtsH [bacterium]